MEVSDIAGSAALVTGGAHGIGAAIVRRLAKMGAVPVVADVDAVAGRALASEVGGLFVYSDVTRPDDSERAIAAAVRTYGSLRIVVLNAGVGVGVASGVGEDFSLAAYGRTMSTNVDGVVFGAHAAFCRMRANGGGDIVVTASLAGLLPTPLDPLYSAGKAAVIALVRALGPAWSRDGVRINALCPGFADTAVVDGVRGELASLGVDLLEPETVADVFATVLTGDRTGECWPILPGRPSAPASFTGASLLGTH